jgi:integrase
VARVSKRGNTFILDYRDENGVRQRKATTAETKGAAKLLLAEKIAQVERINLGLDAAPVRTVMTLWQLCEWWLNNRCPAKSLKKERNRLEVHVKRAELGKLDIQEVSPERLESHFKAMEKNGKSPGTVNRLRAGLRRAFNTAAKKDAGPLWTGANPVRETTARKVPKVVRASVKVEEVPLLLRFTPRQWRGFFAVAVYLALRKGEICGLKKSNVDLENNMLLVANSYGGGPKGEAILALPIVPELKPYLATAMAASPNDLVFPSADGSMRNEDSDPEKRLRSALKRAGLVDGYAHTCRRCGVARAAGGGKGGTKPNPFAMRERVVQQHPDAEPRRCPQCDMKMHAEGKPRGNMRFHDLRHSTAHILMQCGVPLYLIQRVLRHANIKTTIDTYGHLDIESIRKALAGAFAERPAATEGPLGPGQGELVDLVRSLLAALGPAGRALVGEMINPATETRPPLHVVREGTNEAQSKTVANMKGGHS